MSRDTEIVLGPDGVVLGASGALAADLVDARLDACEGLPQEVRAAGSGLVAQLRRSLMMSDICAAHGGRIDVHSRVGDDHGTTVRVTLATI